MIDRALWGSKIVVNDDGEVVFGQIESEIGAECGRNGVHFVFFLLSFFLFFLFFIFALVHDVCGLDMFCFVYLMILRYHLWLKMALNDVGEMVFGEKSEKNFACGAVAI